MDSVVHGTTERVASTGRPVIGISSHTGPAKWARFELDVTLMAQLIVDRVAATGCTPVLLPPLPGIENAIGRLDGLLVPGGGDLNPTFYGAAPHPKSFVIGPERDAAELALVTAAVAQGVPFLGLCRGLQVLNVARGGTLHQFLPELVGHGGHGPDAAPQRVRLDAGSQLAKVVGSDSIDVDCRHHQAIDEIGAGVTPTAWTDDGVIEAAEVPDHPFAVGVQWHAEDAEDDHLFEALAEAARHASTRARR